MPTSPLAADDARTARDILAVSGVRAGLCAHIGGGRDGSPGLTAELAANSKLLVHGICWDSAALARAQAAITARKVTGQASVEIITGRAPPYVPYLCNLIVVEDMKALAANGIGRDELMRVLAPGGVLCILANGRWTKTVQPRPEGMDDWTHPHHGPDGNMVSSDRLVRFPMGLRWIGGIPKSINSFASVRGWVLANGRCYIVSSNVADNLAPGLEAKGHYLLCRDAFNGLPLWKIPLATAESGSGLHWRNTSPLAADDQRVYAVGKGKAIIVDGATGKVEHTLKTTYQPERMVLLDNTLVLSCWETRDWTKAPFERGGGAGPWVNTTSGGSVEAYAHDTGRRLWKLDYPAYSVLAADGTVYLLTRNANPATENNVIAVDVRSGRERWRVAHTELGDEPDLQLDLAGPGFLAVSKRKAEALKILEAKTGKVLWSGQYHSVRPGHWKELRSYRFMALVDGDLWYADRKYNPLTGDVVGKLPEGVPKKAATICVPPTVIGNLVADSRRCKYLQLPDASNRSAPPRTITFHAARGGCIQGMVPANGMFYTSQNNCGCEPGQILGFLAFGPNGALPAEEVFARARPVERGPAFARAKPASTDPDAWPMHRANARRSRSTNAKSPDALGILWQRSVARGNTGPMKSAWDARLAAVITPPVAAGGRVFVAATELGQVRAFDIATGKAAWTVMLGSRIDSAPTIVGNLCVIGSHDGWLYALMADTGALAWRTRIAPLEQRIVVNGRVESTWPAVGSVLVHEGKLLAHAGRGTEADGGIAVVQLDPATGKSLWAGVIGPGPRRRIDLLRVAGGTIACNETAIDPTAGVSQKREIKPRPRGGPMLDAYLGRAGMRGFTTALHAWDDRLAIAAGGGAGSAVPFAAPPTSDPRKGRAAQKKWRIEVIKDIRINGLAIANEHVVVAGALPVGGQVQLIDKASGRQIAALKLDSAPIYDGLAVADGKVFVALEDGRVLCLGNRE